MPSQKKVRVAVNGYGVIGKRVAEAIRLQDDMVLSGISDVATDWRIRIATRKGFALYGATQEDAQAMKRAGLDVAGTLDDRL
jgi:glyceraldehyde-3-phosphate dehydrogenase (NAD(P))